MITIEDRLTEAGFAFRPGERALLVYGFPLSEHGYNEPYGTFIHVTTLTEQLHLLEIEVVFPTKTTATIHLIHSTKDQMLAYLDTLHTNQTYPLNTIETFKDQWDYVYKTLRNTHVPQLCALLKMDRGL